MQDKQSWLKWRKIGGSDAPVIMGVSPWKTRTDLWKEKVFDTTTISNKAMEWGKNHESTALEHFNNINGFNAQPGQFEHPEHDFMTVTMDGVCKENSIAVELKCPYSLKVHDEFIQKGISKNYYPQVQHEHEIMEKFDIKKMYFASFHPQHSQPYVQYEIDKADHYCKMLVEEERIFWKHVQEKVPPEDDFVFRDDDEFDKIQKRYITLKELADAYNMELKQAKAELIDLASGKPLIGEWIKISKIKNKGKIDYSQIEILNQLDLNQYRKPYEYWDIDVRKA